MPTYTSIIPANIPNDRPRRVTSTIDVTQQGRAASVEIKLDAIHDRPSDLRVWLVPPSGRQILVRDRGRAALQNYTVIPAMGEPVFGRWTLMVDDVKAGDGGTLRAWDLTIATYSAPLLIELDFRKGLTDSQKDVFRVAMGRLQVALSGTRTTGLTVVISAAGIEIDGRGGILGQAGPTKVRQVDGLPLAGIMEFDTHDIVRMEINGSLQSLLMHEMAHVLGFGTLFGLHKLVQSNRFIGSNASREYGDLTGKPPESVPLEDDGGPGTQGGHWEEEVFGHELMTGYLSGSHQPFSRISVGAFEDLGYDVDYSAADPYVFGARSLLLTAAPSLACNIKRPEFEVV